VIRLAVRVRRDQAEVVLAELLELAPGGVEEVAVSDGIVEYAVYGAAGELPALPELTAAAGPALVDVRTSEVADDWDVRWRQFHRPLVLRERLAVRPPWEPPGLAEVDLVIDPGQAFGTGAHATTRLCLEFMLDLPASGGFLDLGCGSGVLAIAAARLGWAPVVAVDFDPVAVEAAAANARVNGVSIGVRRHDLRVEPPVCAPTVAANLLGPLLLAWAGQLRSAGELPERIIASGLLVGEADEVGGAFEGLGFRESARRASGEWAALLLDRRGSSVDNLAAPDLVHRADVPTAPAAHPFDHVASQTA
jgi:ribosomal protein L11 methyltransferase